jgi:hypothetical protein
MTGIDRARREVLVPIESGQSISAEPVETDAYTMFNVFVPSGTEGTHLQFLEDKSGTAKTSRKEDDTLKVVPFTAGEWVDAPTECANLWRMYIRTCSEPSGTPQTQTGATILTLRCKG